MNETNTIQTGYWFCATPGCNWQGSQPCPFHSFQPPEQPAWPWNVAWAAQRAYEAMEGYYRALTEQLHADKAES